MNLGVENLKENMKNARIGFIKGQDYYTAAILREMEIILDRINVTEAQDQFIIDSLEDLRNKLKRF